MSKNANDANTESLHNKIAPNESPDPNAKKKFLKPLIWIEKNIVANQLRFYVAVVIVSVLDIS